MELEKIPLEKKRDEGGEGTSKLVVEVKAEEEAQPDHYAALQTPAEDIYAEASFGGSPAKAGKQTEGNARLYRTGCLFFTLISLVLMLAVIVLSVKSQTGSKDCPGTGDDGRCWNIFPKIQAQKLDCHQCGDGWLLFENTCFYLSTVRLTWSMSKKNCTAGKGDLAVISSQSVQTFLTGKAKSFFWIGLKHDANHWRWVDNNPLGDRYWEDNLSNGDCGLLRGDGPPLKNWMRASCNSKAYFICEKQH
ncbi:early activation antigen CD69-like isoform X1 [Platichthys flesus]|uniref:early activation antigen CD69-like isoform X1 n=1 Tax=Platichthys flesus TaxID=8260 RepID=UPI002DBC1F24|nr:early activation antigen CD69-like isoform X1 [Platichthys flesus]